MINFVGKEIKKLAKKRKYESVVFIIKGGISITELMNDNYEFKDFMVEINDMQISEDLQLIVLHMCMQWIYKNNS